MKKSHQNTVPEEFNAFYGPILKLKKLLQSNTKELGAEHILSGFVIMHYSTFVMSELYSQLDVSKEKIYMIRDLIELILSRDTYQLSNEQRSKLYSYVDNLGKELNTTYKPYIYIAMYQAYQNAEIYRHIHSGMPINDFIQYQYIQPETTARMKEYYKVSMEVLNDLNLPIDKQPPEDLKAKLKIK